MFQWKIQHPISVMPWLLIRVVTSLFVVLVVFGGEGSDGV